MRVLLVSEFFPPVRGGLEFHVQSLAAELARQGHEVRVATLTRAPSLGAVPAETVVHSIPSIAHVLPHEDRDRPFHPPLPDPIARRSLRRVLQSFDPDVVHAHNWLGISVPRRGRARFVVTMHDYALVCHLRTLFDSEGRICSGPAPGKCLRCGTAQIGLVRTAALAPATAVGRRLLRPDALVAVSTAVADAVRPYVPEPIEVIPNFVGEPAAPQPLPHDFPKGRYVLYAGDTGAHKGIDDLLEAWQQTQVPNTTLVLATTRPLARSLPPDIYATTLSAGQMTSAWPRATLAVVPSRWADPCPTVAIEAHRAGVPVVATAVGGLPDLVTDGVDGLLVPSRDPLALGAAIRRLAGDEALRARYAAASASAADAHRAESVTARLVEVYQRSPTRAPAGRR